MRTRSNPTASSTQTDITCKISFEVQQNKFDNDKPTFVDVRLGRKKLANVDCQTRRSKLASDVRIDERFNE